MQNFIPNLDYADLTDTQLCDEIGRLDIMVKAYTQALNAAKTNFKVRGIEMANGENFTVSVRTDTRWTLDTKALKKEFGDSWYDKRCTISTVSTMSIKPNAGLVAKTEAA